MREPEQPAPSSDDIEVGSPLSEHVARNVQAVTEMHLQVERGVSAHQRAVERATSLLGRPAALYVIVALALTWILVALVLPHLGLGHPDPAPFFALQGIIGFSALLATTMVLITQNRQAAAHQRHVQYELQVSMLTEQKVTKLIELIEELRRDLPNVRNRRDAVVDALTQPAETEKVIAALEEQTVEAIREAVANERAAEAIARTEEGA